MNIFATYYLYFIIYSFLGWLCETTYCSIGQGKFINRGFLMGPFCPIYGTGAVAVLILLKGFKDNIFIFFFMSIIVAAIVEYVTSYLLEKIFNLTLWDYSNEKFNLNGRICLKNLLMFAGLCLIIIYVTDPILSTMVYLIPNWILWTILIGTTIWLIIDGSITYVVTKRIKNMAVNHQLDLQQMTQVREGVIKDIETDVADVKEENILKKSFKRAFNKKNKIKYAYKRMLQAFPTMKMPNSPETIKKLRENLKKTTKYFRRNEEAKKTK